MWFSFISHLRRKRQCDPETATHTSKEAMDSSDDNDDDDDVYDDHGDNSSIADADVLLSLKKGQTTSQPAISLNSLIH